MGILFNDRTPINLPNMHTHLLDRIPLGGFLILTIVLSMLCLELGYLLSKHRREKGIGDSESSVGSMVGSTLALLAFMLAFTFGLAYSRFDDRRALVVEEANAIGTAFLRADLIDEPHRSAVKNILREYIDIRVQGSRHPSLLEMAVRKSESLHDDLWAQAAMVGRTQDSDVIALFIDSVNEVIDIHTKRLAAGIQGRVPESIWAALFFVAALAMAGMGYQIGLTGHRSWLTSVILVLTFSTVLWLIADLDRPWEGLLNVSQQSLVNLSEKIGLPVRK